MSFERTSSDFSGAESAVIRCRGHANISAGHAKTLELTDERQITPRGSCVVGVDAQYDARELAALRGPVRITLEVGGFRDELSAVIAPTFTPGEPLIVRRHPVPQGNTFAFGADKAASDLDPALIAALQSEQAELVVTITPEPTASGSPQGILYVISLPIGNDRDITLRARETLAGVDRILAEDTRSAAPLLKSLGVRRRALSCHEHNEDQRAEQIGGWLAAGERIALISEAGAPGCSDPGYPVIRAAIQAGAQVTAAPGASAVLVALTVSGLPSDRFAFVGFLPRTGAKRRRAIGDLLTLEMTLVAFESPHRLVECLADWAEKAPERRMAIACNLTRYNETVSRGTAAALSEEFSAREAVRGEYALVIDRAPAAGGAAQDGEGGSVDALLLELLKRDIPIKPLSQALAAVRAMPRRHAFDHLLALKRTLPGGSS